MLARDRAPDGRRTLHRELSGAAALLLAAVVLAACTSGATGGSDGASDEGAASTAPLPTLPGGVDLVALDPSAVLVGEDLAFGAPLPSEQAAADAFATDPEITDAVARRVHAADGRRLADALVLVLDGDELFDDVALDAFERAVVEAMGGGPATDVVLAARTVRRASDGATVAVGFREGNLLTIVTGPVEADVQLTVTRQLEAIARGDVGGPPVTPLVAIPADSVFVEVPTVAFAPILPAAEEPLPDVPSLPGAGPAQGRYGVVAGERRTLVWAFALDGAAYPSAEATEPAQRELAAARAGGAPVEVVELVDRVVLEATDPSGGRSARVFRHRGLVLLVEGEVPEQLDAVVTAWITALGPG